MFSLGHWSEVPLVTKDTSGAPKQYNWLNDIKIIRPWIAKASRPLKLFATNNTSIVSCKN